MLKGSIGCACEECTKLATTTNVWNQIFFVVVLTISRGNVDFCLARVLPFLFSFINVGVIGVLT